ncbi:hypothetical protein GCM10010436_73700 [Paractinoplanes durhamensis]
MGLEGWGLGLEGWGLGAGGLGGRVTEFAEVGALPPEREAEIQEIGVSSHARGPDIKKIEVLTRAAQAPLSKRGGGCGFGAGVSW